MNRIPVAILGPTGYTGLELIEIIARHPSMRIGYLGSARSPGPRIDAEFPRLAGRMGDANPQCEPLDHDAIVKRARLAFLCLPHEAAMEHAPKLLERGVKVVDLSAAYRIKDVATYERYYGHHHTDQRNLEHAVYGLTEFARAEVKTAMLVANPGCYPTVAALALVPLLKHGLIDPSSIIINAASGVSGAGREPKAHTTLVEAGENFSTYGIGVHRHQPEIGQSLRRWGKEGGRAEGVKSGSEVGEVGGGKGEVGIGRGSGGGMQPDREEGLGSEGTMAGAATPDPLFVPHLLPIERGILETIYAKPTDSSVDTARVMEALSAAYTGEPFVQVRKDAPTLRDVQRTNMVHLNARVVGGMVVVGAEDNLVKGASGQAVQNANLMLGLDEAAGLN